MKQYECATCHRRVEFDGALPQRYPFCSERCQMADLGLWFNEAYSIDRPLTPEELADAESNSTSDRARAAE